MHLRMHCILFRGDNADLTECPECGVSRYKCRKDGGDDKRRNGAPRKVAWYFPVIPRVKRMFASKKEAQLLRWHKEGRKDNDNYLRHPADSTQWRTSMRCMDSLQMIQEIFDLR